MKRRGKIWLPLLLAPSLLLWACQNTSAPYTYGPACQWIRFYGEVVIPQGAQVRRPLELTVTYQLPNMPDPATLLTNQPLSGDKFKYILAGFNSEIENTIFVPPMFLFAKQITFRYYVTSLNQKWISDTETRTFLPPHLPKISIPANQNREYLCHSGIDFGKLRLKPAPKGTWEKYI